MEPFVRVRMEELTVQLKGGTEVDLREVSVGVADDVIAFEIEGLIRGLDRETLDAVANKDLEPTEIRFAVTEG